jgi:hypothetical protein
MVKFRPEASMIYHFELDTGTSKISKDRGMSYKIDNWFISFDPLEQFQKERMFNSEKLIQFVLGQHRHTLFVLNFLTFRSFNVPEF